MADTETRDSAEASVAADLADERLIQSQGLSGYLVTDVRLQFRIDRPWRASVGIDNLGKREYRAFHPSPQHTLHAEVRWDL